MDNGSQQYSDVFPEIARSTLDRDSIESSPLLQTFEAYTLPKAITGTLIFLVTLAAGGGMISVLRHTPDVIRSNLPGAIFLGVFFLFMLWVGAFTVYLAVATRDLTTKVHEAGLVRCDHGAKIAVGWSEVVEVVEDIPEAGHVPTSYLLVTTDGYIFQYGVLLRRRDRIQLGLHIERYVGDRLLTAFQEELRRGEVLPFGVFELSSRALIIKGKAWDWGKIKAVRIQQDRVVVSFRRVLRFSYTQPILGVPNARSFVRLASDLIAQQPGEAALSYDNS